MKAKTFIITTLAAICSISVSFAEGEECDKKGKCKKGGKGISAEKKAEILAEFDADGDGKLSEDERKAAMEARKKAFMEKYDTDGDGELSDDEKAAAREARKKAIIAKFDKDGDGELNDEEKKAAREAFGKRRGGKRGKGGDRGPKGGGAGI